MEEGKEAAAPVRYALRTGVKIASAVVHSVPTRVVPVEVAAALRSGDEGAVSAAAETVQREHKSWRARMTRIRHRRVKMLWRQQQDQDHALTVCDVDGDTVVLAPGTSLLSAPFRALRSKLARPCALSYKYDGENWLVRYASGTFSFLQRSDRRPLPMVADLRRNFLNVPAPYCVSTSDIHQPCPTQFLVGEHLTCRVCGALVDEEQVRAHLAHDAVVAARTGRYAAFFAAYATVSEAGVSEDGGEMSRLDDEAARLAVFTTKPFNTSVFWFASAIKGRRKGKGRKGKKRRGGGGGGGGAVVVPRVAAQVWDHMAACTIGRDGKVAIRVTSDDFMAPDAVAWQPCHAEPDPVTLHWPGYRLVAKLTRDSAAGAPCAPSDEADATGSDSFAAAEEWKGVWDAAIAASKAGARDIARHTARLWTLGWRLSVVVSVLRLPPRTGRHAEKWHRMLRHRSTVWRTGVGSVPERWQAVWSETASGVRDGGKGRPKPSAEAGHMDRHVAAFEIPAEEVVRFHLQSDAPTHTFGAMCALGATSATTFAWLRRLGHVEAWTDSGEPVWQHSFEMVGQDYQRNREGVPRDVNLLVPHGWHPHGTAWARAVTSILPGADAAAAPETRMPLPLVDVRRWDYFAVVATLAADADMAVCKEGLVMYMPQPPCVTTTVPTPPHGTPASATVVPCVAVKLRRDHFGLPAPGDNPQHPLFLS